LIIETREPNKHMLTLSNGARLEIMEGNEGRVRIYNADSYTNQMVVSGMADSILNIIVRPKEKVQ